VTGPGKIPFVIVTLALAALLAPALSGQIRSRPMSSSTQVNGLVVLVTENGPRPASATLKDAPFVLLVHNRTGAKDLKLSLTKDEPYKQRLDNSYPAELKQVAHQDGAWDQGVLLDLEPGTYYLTARGKDAWQVKIAIIP
jgi:hypothetical protein